MSITVLTLDFSEAICCPASLYNAVEDGWIANALLLDPKDEETPLAWDADLEIDGDNAIITGGVDACGFGSVTIKLPKKRLNTYYTLTLDVFPEHLSSVKTLLENNRISFISTEA